MEEQPADKPPIFIGINLPARHGTSDQQTVEAALEQGYDMITARLTSKEYRKRVQSLFYGLEKADMMAPETSLNSATKFDSSASSSDSPDPNRHSGQSFSNRKVKDSLRERSSSQSVDKGSLFETEVPAPELEDVALLPGPHVSNTIALASPWIEIDSKSSRIATLSLQAIRHEIAYARYCGLPYVVMSGPKRRTNVAQFAQTLSTILQECQHLQLALHIPFTEEYTTTEAGDLIPPSDYLSVWDVWNTIRTICNYPANLSVALQLPKHHLPEYVVSRWFAEPVSMLVISSSIFISNAKGFPVLSKALQSLLFKFFKKNPFLIIEDSIGSNFQGGDDAFLIYLRHLHHIAPQTFSMEEFYRGFVDRLQVPLQPLIDNLDSSTYEVFERDSVKYDQYQLAIFHALLDKTDRKITVAVLGAGRGPLVTRTLLAAKEANRTVKIYALEKNANAYIHLMNCQMQEWGDSVQVIKGDMRSWKPPQPLSIVITELLGSFGDNELSPECLDGAVDMLEHDGIMIPTAYTSYFTPIFSPKLYSATSSVLPKDKRLTSSTGTSSIDSLQMPYVVMMQQVDLVSPYIKQAWKFNHPSYDSLPENQHNTRKCKQSFPIEYKGMVHGFAGYFETVLYKDIKLSTRPDNGATISKDMVSWFPLYFPFSHPIYVNDSSEVDISIWRLTDGRKVWYEWTGESFLVVPNSKGGHRRIRSGQTILHNQGGKYYSMAL